MNQRFGEGRHYDLLIVFILFLYVKKLQNALLFSGVTTVTIFENTSRMVT